jgi:DNA-binding NtrC family response regulator
MPASAKSAVKSEFLIYVVDDEEIMLEIAEVALRRDGFAVEKFTDPEAAFSALQNTPHKPSLLLTDYAMGPMNGVELSTRCKSAHPTLKILIVSGTAGPEVVRSANGAVDGFIAKPYKSAQLARAVRDLLSRS